MDAETLLKRKEELKLLIDELQIKMISARGRKLAFMAADLDDLEAEKSAIKQKLKGGGGGAGAAAAAGAPPSRRKEKASAPSRVQMSDVELQALAREVAALEEATLAEEDEANRRYFELYSEKMALYAREEALYKEEQVVLLATLPTDPMLSHVIKCQRIARQTLRRRRWKGEQPMLAPVVESYRKSAASLADRNRWALVMKIYKSQKAYVESITVAVDKYLVPLRKTNSHASGVTREEVRKMFGQLEVIAALDVDVLSGLHSRLYGRFTHTAIGDVLVQMGPLFSLYEEYCRTYDEMLTTLATLQRTNKLFFKFLGSLYERSGVKRPLTSLLELPAQRLFEYRTILGALVKATPSGHADLQYFRSTLSKVTASVKNVERMQASKRAAQQLKQLGRRISGLPSSLTSGGSERVMTGERMLREVSPKQRMIHFYLLSDVLVRAVQGSKKEKFVDAVPLLGIQINSLPDSGSMLNAFEMRVPKHEPWVVCARSYADKVHAEKMFRKAVRAQSRVAGMAAKKDSKQQIGVYRAKLEAAVGTQSDRLSHMPQSTLRTLKREGPCMAILECLAAPDGEALRALCGNRKALTAALMSLEAYSRLLGLRMLVKHPEMLTSALGTLVARQWMQSVIGGVSSVDLLCSNVVSNLSGAPALFLAFAQRARADASAQHHTQAAANAAASVYVYVSLVEPAIKDEQLRAAVAKRFKADGNFQRQLSQALPSVEVKPKATVPISQAKDELLPNIHKHLISKLDSVGPLMSEDARRKLIDAIAIAIVLQQ